MGGREITNSKAQNRIYPQVASQRWIIPSPPGYWFILSTPLETRVDVRNFHIGIIQVVFNIRGMGLDGEPKIEGSPKSSQMQWLCKDTQQLSVAQALGDNSGHLEYFQWLWLSYDCYESKPWYPRYQQSPLVDGWLFPQPSGINRFWPLPKCQSPNPLSGSKLPLCSTCGLQPNITSLAIVSYARSSPEAIYWLGNGNLHQSIGPINSRLSNVHTFFSLYTPVHNQS